MNNSEFIIGCNKQFEPNNDVYGLLAGTIRTLTSQSALNCGDKFDGGKGVTTYLCGTCAKENQMTEQQEEAVQKAQDAFVAALDAGAEEDILIEAVFEATIKRRLLEPLSPSEEKLAKLFAIINERTAYNMKEFAEHCRSFL